MGSKNKSHHYRFYLPWYSSDDDLYEEGEDSEDSWVNYLRRNLQHSVGEESPFPDSSWSYTRNDSPFEEEDHLKKSDTTIQAEVADALYAHPDVDSSHIRCLVLNGIVCLFGTVPNLLARETAQRVVKELPGVWSVRNELAIDDSGVPHSLAKVF